MNFSNIRAVAPPEGELQRIVSNNLILWEKHIKHLPSEYQRIEYIETNGGQYLLYNHPP